MNQDRTYVIGHRNPDTDSICSAIAYAELKNNLAGDSCYHARRAGQISQETAFVLNRFGVTPPAYLADVRTQVKDIEYRKVEGISYDMSLRRAWERMTENNLVTLPVLEGRKLEGLITIGDITKAYMDVRDSCIITKANTSFHNIIDTLEGEMVVGNPDENLREGKVLIAAANPDLMESYIEKGDIVILGNRYESQLCAIEMSAKCIVVCDGAMVSYTISKLAESKGCTIIKTPYDTYTVARLINQSMPVGYFMMKKENLITFTEDNYIDDIRETMAKLRHRDFPILNKNGDFCGMVSRRNLLDARKKKIILVDHNEPSQAVDGLEEAEILEIIDHHRLGSIETMGPVYFRNQPLGCTATIIYQMYLENQVPVSKQIAGLLCSAILSDTLVYRSPTCTETDRRAAEKLAQIAGIEVSEYAKEMFTAGSNLKEKALEEIFYQDYKEFSAGKLRFGVGQLNSMDGDELKVLKERILSYMEKAYKEHKIDMLFFMLTDILAESTELLYVGDSAKETLEEAFHTNMEDRESIVLNGVVSRKKQLVPALMMSLQQDAV